jgi:hypothetical protein
MISSLALVAMTISLAGSVRIMSMGRKAKMSRMVGLETTKYMGATAMIS